VCQENCPVSPKAIFTRDVFNPVRLDHPLTVASADKEQIVLSGIDLMPGRYASGDFYCQVDSQSSRRIVRQTEQTVSISAAHPFDPAPQPGDHIQILIRLQQPVVTPDRCIGCGICEHECPVSGLRAIRVTAENESRNARHGFLLS
ncbi:MAG: 4Fe-4S binding protein, partial [Thermodesulfobacteriota bacterium]|nr:4Fe-4S binding protein [Thermodesulfobacteriota bacterium]